MLEFNWARHENHSTMKQRLKDLKCVGTKHSVLASDVADYIVCYQGAIE